MTGCSESIVSERQIGQHNRQAHRRPLVRFPERRATRIASETPDPELSQASDEQANLVLVRRTIDQHLDTRQR